jgi:transcription elongation factor Elf1
MLSNWEAEVLQDEVEQFERRFELQERQKRNLVRDTFELSWEFDCPICGNPTTLICELQDDALEKREIQLNRAVCVSCGLVIPDNCPTLADELCADQLVEARPLILQEYGLTEM